MGVKPRGLWVTGMNHVTRFIGAATAVDEIPSTPFLRRIADSDWNPLFSLESPIIIEIITDSNAVNVLKSTLALLHHRECGIARCHTALKALAVGR